MIEKKISCDVEGCDNFAIAVEPEGWLGWGSVSGLMETDDTGKATGRETAYLCPTHMAKIKLILITGGD